MKTHSTDQNKKSLDALLAEMPLEPREDFADRVLECIADHSVKIERALKASPVEPNRTFTEKTVAAIEATRATKDPFTQRFVRRFAALAASLAVVAGTWFMLAPKAGEYTTNSLAEHVAHAVQSDPELYAMTQDGEDSLSFDEFLAASQILATIDPSNLEILAYND